MIITCRECKKKFIPDCLQRRICSAECCKARNMRKHRERMAQ